MEQPLLPFTASSPPNSVSPRTDTLHVAPSTLHDLDFVRHPRARRYVIRVRADGRVRVTIPRGGSKREAQAFAERERQWIAAERGRMALEAARPRDLATSHDELEMRERARHELPRRLLELAAIHGLRVSRVSVRNQRWRWGSCSPNGHICLNWRLVRMPPAIRDYVILHELMHLKRMDHSPAFWKLVAKVCPDYQAARKWLRALPDTISPLCESSTGLP